MKTFFAVMAVAGLAAGAVADQTYNDTNGDVFTGAGGGILDILSVEVSNTATDISFKFTLAGDVIATDWGKYMVIIDRAAGGDTASNGWNRPISMTSGADSWIGSWVDGSLGAELYHYTGAWGLTEATYNGPPNNDISISKTQFSVTISTPLSALGVGIGDTFAFDAFTSGGGGGDGAIDSLGNPGIQVGDWGQPSNAVPQNYTVVPAPGVLGLLGVGGLVAIRRRR